MEKKKNKEKEKVNKKGKEKEKIDRELLVIKNTILSITLVM